MVVVLKELPLPWWPEYLLFVDLNGEFSVMIIRDVAGDQHADFAAQFAAVLNAALVAACWAPAVPNYDFAAQAAAGDQV